MADSTKEITVAHSTKKNKWDPEYKYSDRQKNSDFLQKVEGCIVSKYEKGVRRGCSFRLTIQQYETGQYLENRLIEKTDCGCSDRPPQKMGHFDTGQIPQRDYDTKASEEILVYWRLGYRLQLDKYRRWETDIHSNPSDPKPSTGKKLALKVYNSSVSSHKYQTKLAQARNKHSKAVPELRDISGRMRTRAIRRWMLALLPGSLAFLGGSSPIEEAIRAKLNPAPSRTGSYGMGTKLSLEQAMAVKNGRFGVKLLEIECVIITVVDTRLAVIERIAQRNIETAVESYPVLIVCAVTERSCISRRKVGKHLFRGVIDVYSSLGSTSRALYIMEEKISHFK